MGDGSPGFVGRSVRKGIETERGLGGDEDFNHQEA